MKNPRKNDAAVDKIADSITAFGFGAPLLARKATGQLIAGHTRLKAALKLGLTVLPVRYLDLDEDRAQLLALADNKLGEIAAWDDAVLATVLADLKKNSPDVDLALSGFADDEIAKLLADAVPADPAPDPATHPKPKPAPAGGTPLQGTPTLLHGDVASVLASYPDNHFDAVVCDPPYGVRFMGKKWDYDVPQAALWREVLRVCKPGAPLIAFSATRTYHRATCQIEDAGFEIRDQILYWGYGSGFPKSLDVSKALDEAQGATRAPGTPYLHPNTGNPYREDAPEQPASDGTSFPSGVRCPLLTAPVTPEAQLWEGYGTALKPAFEPAVLARKPLEGTVVENVTKYGVGALAIDASRVNSLNENTARANGRTALGVMNDDAWEAKDGVGGGSPAGRWPANLILDEQAGAELDAQSGERPSTPYRANTATGTVLPLTERTAGGYSDSGGASRFFYCAKASRRERELGCDDLPLRTPAQVTDREEPYFQVFVGDVLKSTHETMHEAEESAAAIGCGAYAREERPAGLDSPRAGAGRTSGARNHHPTVKPASLARYLCGLVLPPPRGPIPTLTPRRLLVPFSGSGSEVIGGLLAGWDEVVGIERDPSYVEIARARVEYAISNPLDYEVDDPDSPEPQPTTG